MIKLLGTQISQLGLKIIAAVCMIGYFISETIIQRGVLHLEQLDSATLLAQMANGSSVMGIATIAILMKLLAGIALPIYAFLLAEGAVHTGDYRKYLVNVLVFALFSEVPFDYALTGKYCDFSKQNPMFALVFGLILIWAIRLIQKNGKSHIGLCILVTFAAALWCMFLRIEFGIVCVILVAVYYLLRSSRGWACLGGFVISLPYITGIFAIYPIFCYSGKRGKSYNKYIFYLMFVITLIICGLVTEQMK